MSEYSHVKVLSASICAMCACLLLSSCGDSGEGEPPAAEAPASSRPAPKPERESLSIYSKDRDTPTALAMGPRFELYSEYAGQDIKQVTGVSGRTLWLCFTAPWCPHSKDMIQELKIMAREEKGSVQVVEINADAYPTIAEDFGITKVPTTILYTEGVKLRTIEGAFNAPSLQRYLHRVLMRSDADGDPSSSSPNPS